MLRFAVAAFGLTLLTMTPASAQSGSTNDNAGVSAGQGGVATTQKSGRREMVGYGRLTTNDLFGDGNDRWRSGSITSSRVWGYGWDGVAPTQFGEMLEFRLQGQIMNGESLRINIPGDRPWAGVLGIGLHTHFASRGFDYAVGADLNIIGPQTNLDDFQTWLHGLIGAPEPSDVVLAQQIGDTIRPTVVAEVGREYTLGRTTRLRPFAEARAGDESLVRIGADLSFGGFGMGELMARENVTGQRYRIVRDEKPGVSFVLGADIAHVFDSVYLPEDRGLELTDARERVRAGIHLQGYNSSFFYGLTWLGREFETQREDQMVGSIRVQFLF